MKKILLIFSFIVLSCVNVFANYDVTVTATAYNAYEEQGICADGSPCIPFQTIAVDPNVIPLGSSVYIPGYGVMVAHDTGGAIVGNRIDIAMDNNYEANNYGVRTITVTVIE